MQILSEFCFFLSYMMFTSDASLAVDDLYHCYASCDSNKFLKIRFWFVQLFCLCIDFILKLTHFHVQVALSWTFARFVYAESWVRTFGAWKRVPFSGRVRISFEGFVIRLPLCNFC